MGRMETGGASGSIMPLKRGLLFTFALPSLIQAFMQAPSQSILQGAYAKESGIALMGLGTAVLIARLFDLCSDMLIGWLSDRTARRGYGRKAWIAAGAVVSAVSIWFLFRPPQEITPMYFGFWFLMANIGWSLIEIPYKAWNLEFTAEPVQRSRIVAWTVMFGLLGNMVFFAVPSVGHKLGLLPNAELSLASMGLAAIIVVVLMIPLNLPMLLRVPRIGPAAVEVRAELPLESVRDYLRTIFGNAPLIRMLVALAITNLAVGLSNGVQLLYVTNYLGLGSSAAGLFVIAIPLGMLTVPFWAWMAGKFPRERMWSVTLMLTGLGYIGYGALPQGAPFAVVAILYAFALIFLLASVVVVPVLLGEIIDYGKEKFGVDRAGIYLSVRNQVLKGIGAVASGAGLIMLGWMGFDAARSGADLTDSDIFALKLVATWAPAVGYLGTGIYVWLFPIGRRPEEMMPAPAAPQA